MRLKTLIIQRHGHADPGPDDRARPLNALGQIVVAGMQGSLTAMGHLPADLTLSSPARRVMDTVEPADRKPVIVLEELGIPPTDTDDGREFNRFFTKLGYAQLGAYQDLDRRDVIDSWAIRAREAMYRTHGFHAARTIHVGCHAVLGNALALKFVSRSNTEAVIKLTTSVLKECDCIVIDVPTGQVTLIIV